MDDTKEAVANPKDGASGRFVLRIEPDLHSRLRFQAQAAGLSLNEYCGRLLAAPTTDAAGPGSAVAARAKSLFAERVVGVVAYGSWARDELKSTSDIDVLIVLDYGTEISRDVYRTWDDAGDIRWSGRVVDAHFAHPLRSAGDADGMWLDVASDGVMLYDRDLGLGRLLASVRALVSSGAVLRRQIHGQPYWVWAADDA